MSEKSRVELIRDEVKLVRAKMNGKLSRVVLDVEYLLRKVDQLTDALKLTATPADKEHLVMPKCLCVYCQQKEILQS